jgi:CRISPR-associated endonuclease Cas2
MGTRFKGIKKLSEYQRGELTKDLLKLVAAGVIMGTAAIAAPNTLQLVEYFDPKSRIERKRIWDAIKYLEQKQRIQFEEVNGISYVHLTSGGRVAVNEDRIWDMQIEHPRRWDKKWRLVMFDFPTAKDKSRHAFRIKLEDLGFMMYQKSVFIYPHECNEEIHTVARWFGVDEYVRYIVATEIHDMRHFARQFNLL